MSTNMYLVFRQYDYEEPSFEAGFTRLVAATDYAINQSATYTDRTYYLYTLVPSREEGRNSIYAITQYARGKAVKEDAYG